MLLVLISFRLWFFPQFEFCFRNMNDIARKWWFNLPPAATDSFHLCLPCENRITIIIIFFWVRKKEGEFWCLRLFNFVSCWRRKRTNGMIMMRESISMFHWKINKHQQSSKRTTTKSPYSNQSSEGWYKEIEKKIKIKAETQQTQRNAEREYSPVHFEPEIFFTILQEKKKPFFCSTENLQNKWIMN